MASAVANFHKNSSIVASVKTKISKRNTFLQHTSSISVETTTTEVRAPMSAHVYSLKVEYVRVQDTTCQFQKIREHFVDYRLHTSAIQHRSVKSPNKDVR